MRLSKKTNGFLRIFWGFLDSFVLFSVFLYFFGEKVAVGAIDLAKAPEK
jgi:hypothetical protein